MVQRQCCFRLQLVVSVVFPGPVYWSGGWACGEQAEFQDVFKGARVRGNGVVFGHAELICHSGLLGCTGLRCPFTVSAVPARGLEVAAPAQRLRGRRSEAGEAAVAHPGNGLTLRKEGGREPVRFPAPPTQP